MLTPADAAARAFTKGGDGPRPTFALALVSVTVAVLAMHVDAIMRYSENAFFAGAIGALVLSIVVGKVVAAVPTASSRLLMSLLLPSAFGAMLGMIVQGIVLYDLLYLTAPVYDLGGAIDTEHPGSWILAG